MEALTLSIRLERRWPLWCALALAIAWLGAAGLDVVAHPRAIAGIALAVLPPLSLATLVASLLPGAGRAIAVESVETRLEEATRTVGDLQARLADVDALLASSAERTERLVSAASDGAGGLAASATALEDAAARMIAGGEDAKRFTEHFRTTLPEIANIVGSVDSTLRAVGADSSTQLRAVETMLAAVQARNREAGTQADTSIANMSALLARIDEASTRNTAALSKRAYALDAAVDGVLERTTAAVDHIREQVEERLQAVREGVEASGKQMTFLGDDSTRLFNQRLELLLRTSEQISGQFAAHEEGSERLRALVEAQLQGIEARLAEVRGNGADVVDTISARIAALDADVGEAADSHLTTFEQRLAEVRVAGTTAADDIGARLVQVDAALAEAAAARAAEIDRQVAQAQAGNMAAIDEIAARLSAMEQAVQAGAAEQLAAFEQRLVEVRAAGILAVDDIGSRVGMTDATLREAAEARITYLAERLGEATALAAAASDDIGARIAAIDAALATLDTPLASARAALEVIDGQATALGEAVSGIDSTLAERIAGTRSAIGGLEDEAQRLFALAGSLRESIAEGSQLVGDAATAFSEERNEVVRLAAQLEGHFDSARSALAEIQAGSAGAASGVAATLGAEFARLEGAADNAALTMRAALTAVVDESVAALREAAASHSRQAFGEPIRAQLAAIESATVQAGEAGQAAAERLAGSMVNLVETIAQVDARVGEVETRFDVRARDSLAARSARLMGQLQESAIDVTRLLAMPIRDDVWAQYLQGDRGVFARNIVGQLDRETSRRMARLFQHDDVFREEAARYVDTFEALIQRLLGDRDGEALAATMLSSDIGKIYVAIAEATERLPPSRVVN